MLPFMMIWFRNSLRWSLSLCAMIEPYYTIFTWTCANYFYKHVSMCLKLGKCLLYITGYCSRTLFCIPPSVFQPWINLTWEILLDKFALLHVGTYSTAVKINLSLTKSQWHRDFIKTLKCNFCQNNNNTSRFCQTHRKSKYPLRSYGFELIFL